MPIRAKCPGCQKVLAVKDHLAGKRVACPLCKAAVQVPNPSAPPPLAVNKPPASAKPIVPAKTPVARPADVESFAADALRDQPAAVSGVPADGAPANGANGHAAVAAPIKFQCDYCEAEVEAPAEQAGTRIPCPECSRIIKVPLPKAEKPKDWRNVEKAGPSLAKINQVEKIEDAWGNETKSKVSDKVLMEAGVLEKPKAPPVSSGVWIGRAVRGVLVAVALVAVGWGIKKAYDNGKERAAENALRAKMDPNWPPVLRAEFKRALAEHQLSQPKGIDKAVQSFREAAQELDGPVAAKKDKSADKSEPADRTADEIDRDFFLIDLVKSQVGAGGTYDEQLDQKRLDWTKNIKQTTNVFDEVSRTISLGIKSPECRVNALREVMIALQDKKQPEMAVSLMESVANGGTRQALQFKVALKVEAGQKGETVVLPVHRDVNRELIHRAGLAEGLARATKVDDALKAAEKPGLTPDKFYATMSVAKLLSLRKDPEMEKACAGAAKLLEKDARSSVGVWPLLQFIRLTARYNPDEAREAAKKLPSAFRRRGQLEVVLGIIDSRPADGAAAIRGLDNDGANRGLAWVALTRARIRAGLPEEMPEDESLRPLVEMVSMAARATK